MGVGGQHRAPAALSPGKTWYPMYRRLGRSQDQSGWVQKISLPPGFDPWNAQPVVRCYTDPTDVRILTNFGLKMAEYHQNTLHMLRTVDKYTPNPYLTMETD